MGPPHGLEESPGSNAAEASDIFAARAIILTYEGASDAIKNNRVLTVTYSEPQCCGLFGNYTLFFTVDELPPPPRAVPVR